MTRRRHSIAAAAFLVLLPCQAAAGATCATRAEAKAIHKGAYLNWHRGPGGMRCWTARQAKPRPHHARRAVPVETPPVIPEPPSPAIPRQLLFPPVPMAPLPIPPEATSAQSIVDFSPWHWTSEAYAATPGPIVTPTPVNRTNKGDRYARASVDALMVMLAALLLCFMVGGTLWRWSRQRDELQI